MTSNLSEARSRNKSGLGWLLLAASPNTNLSSLQLLALPFFCECACRFACFVLISALLASTALLQLPTSPTAHAAVSPPQGEACSHRPPALLGPTPSVGIQTPEPAEREELALFVFACLLLKGKGTLSKFHTTFQFLLRKKGKGDIHLISLSGD